jgi:arylsulfatase A-like enzyme
MSSPNVLLVVLDSVRAKNTSLHDYHRETTPYLSELAEEATVYEQARAPGIHSIASHVSIFTGYEVDQHRVYGHKATIDNDRTVWRELEREGYDTGLFTPNIVVGDSSNLYEAFEHFRGSERLFPDALSPAEWTGNISVPDYIRECLKHDKPVQSFANGVEAYFRPSNAHSPTKETADVYAKSFLDWQADRDGPWAACINLMDAHFPYFPLGTYDRWAGEHIRRVHEKLPDDPLSKVFLRGRPMGELAALEHLYDGCILQMDRVLESLVGELRRRGEYEDTLLVVTSDHGEGFGEPSALERTVPIVDHSWGVEEFQTHVPLLVKHPGQTEGDRVSDLATLSRFPAAVRSELDGERGTFCPESGEVVVSTFRLPESTDLSSDVYDVETLRGPWRAVYRREDGTVKKYVERRGTAATFEVRDAQTSFRVADTDDGVVDEVYDRLDEVDLEGEERDVSGLTEQRLEDLGYIE